MGKSRKRTKWTPGRISELIERLKTAVPEGDTELKWDNPYQLLISTMLSAQTTDKKVNEIAPGIYARYPTPKALASGDPSDVEAIIQPLGFFRQKTRSIIGAADILTNEHKGEVPRSMEDLVKLPGVGRKTAAVVLGTAFGINEGIFVDTHVKRVSYRLGLTEHADPIKIEQDLMKLLPRDEWTETGHRLVLHGRYTCVARAPKCPECVLESLCPKIDVTKVQAGSEE